MITVYADKEGNGSIWWRERIIPLEGVFLVRVCMKNWKVEINYKDKPREFLQCTEPEVKQIIDQLKGA